MYQQLFSYHFLGEGIDYFQNTLSLQLKIFIFPKAVMIITDGYALAI